MADTEKPSEAKSAQAARVADVTVPDAKRGLGRPPNQPRTEHADREPPPESETHRPSSLSPADRGRFDLLRSKLPNPHVLPLNVRTEDEEYEYRRLSQAVANAEQAAALDAADPGMRRTPKQRLDELKKKGHANLGEGETIEMRRLEDLMRDEKRIDELMHDDKRVPEEDDELRMLQQRAAEARANGGYAEAG